jgi:hypothetical protein
MPMVEQAELFAFVGIEKSKENTIPKVWIKKTERARSGNPTEGAKTKKGCDRGAKEREIKGREEQERKTNRTNRLPPNPICIPR